MQFGQIQWGNGGPSSSEKARGVIRRVTAPKRPSVSDTHDGDKLNTINNKQEQTVLRGAEHALSPRSKVRLGHGNGFRGGAGMNQD